MTASTSSEPTPQDVLVREMRWWHIEPVSALEQQLFPRDAWTQEQLWSELAAVPDSRWYVVAERDGQVVGYAGLFSVPPEADVQTVAVAPEMQGHGLGRRLVDELVAEAGRRGCTTMLLEVAAGNDTAQHLYASAGFEVLSRRSGYYADGTDAVVMRRRLAEPTDG